MKHGKKFRWTTKSLNYSAADHKIESSCTYVTIIMVNELKKGTNVFWGRQNLELTQTKNGLRTGLWETLVYGVLGMLSLSIG